MKILKVVLLPALALLGMALFSHAQQTQPATLNTPVQYNPFNSVTGAGGTGTASVTITGVAGQRVRIYQIIAVCNTGGTNTVPTVVVTDGVNTLLSIPNYTVSSDSPPIRPLSFLPGLTASSGGTVVISANIGAACGGGTSLTVQADQF